MLEWLIFLGLACLAKIFIKPDSVSDRIGGVVIPLSSLPSYHRLEAGVYSAVLIRQSGNVHTDLGTFLTPEGALMASIKAFSKSKIEELRVVHASDTKLAAYRRFPHMKGTDEGRKLGGVQVVRVRDLTEGEAALLRGVPTEREALRFNPAPLPLIKRADLDRILAEEAEERISTATKSAPPKLEELLKMGASPLKAWREVRQMTVGDLSAATKIQPRILMQFENLTRRPTSEQVALLAQSLSVDVQDIVR